jgi:hypothetical protein
VDARIVRLCLCLLVAAFATGCTTLRGWRSTHSSIPSDPGNANLAPNDPGTSPPSTIPGGTVIATGGVGTPGAQAPPPGGGQPNVIPAPRPLPVSPPPGWPPGVPVPPNGQPPPQMMPTPGAPPGYVLPNPGADPHLRISPTVTGARLNLAPYEVPADRVVELSKNLEIALAQNRDLVGRIKELETRGIGREQALAEAVREIDAITAAGLRERSALQAQILALQGKVKQLEEEDIIFLRAVIEALGKLLPPEKKP